MRCFKDFGSLCPECPRTRVVQPDRTDGTPVAVIMPVRIRKEDAR